MTGSSPATRRASRWCSKPRGRSAARRRPDVAVRLVGEAALPDGRRAVPVFQLVAERYLDPLCARGGGRRPAAFRRRRSAGSPPRWRRPRSKRRSSCRCRGPTGPAGVTKRCAGARCRCMRCAASRRIRTASRPAARCTCCRYCSARSTCRGAGATSRRIPSRRRPGRSRPASPTRSSPASRCRASRSAIRCRPRI